MAARNQQFYILRWWLIVCVAILTAAFAIWRSNRTLLAHQRQVEESLADYGDLTEVQNLLSTLKDAETGQRGYLLTGNPEYLAPYESALRSLPEMLRSVTLFTRDNPSEQAEIQQITRLSGEKLVELSETIRIRQTEGLARALQVVESGRGARTMDQLRALLGNFQRQRRSDLQRAIDRSTAAEADARIVIAGGYIVIVALFVFAISVISRNIRQRIAAEERDLLAQREIVAERRYRELMQAAPDGILEVSPEGLIVLLNPAAEQLFGYSKEELLGRSVDDLVPESLRARHAEHRARFATSPGTRAMGSGLDLYGLRKDGSTFPVEISLSPLSGTAGIRVAAIIRDVSERKRSEERIRGVQDDFTARLAAANQELEERNKEVERANRLKSEFLANMSHELRTPLHTVIGFSELLAEGMKGPLNTDQRRFVDHIYKDANHLLTLINDLLDLSKIEAGRLHLTPEPLDLQGVIEDTLSSIRPNAAARSIIIDTQVLPGLFIAGDRIRVRQILFNLLGNAIKFTPERGHVRIEAVQSGPFARISVSDTGIGIPPEEQDAVFDKFHQVASGTGGSGGGTGLGLPITRQLVEEHGGRIWLRSEPGHGSCFTFTIPLSHTHEKTASSGR